MFKFSSFQLLGKKKVLEAVKPIPYDSHAQCDRLKCDHQYEFKEAIKTINKQLKSRDSYIKSRVSVTVGTHYPTERLMKDVKDFFESQGWLRVKCTMDPGWMPNNIKAHYSFTVDLFKV